MAEAIQACERIPGQDTCPFHPGHKITSLCKTCGILVCLECIMSNEHKEHEFKKISECFREPTNAIAKRLTNIDKNLLVDVDQELDAVKRKRKESIQKHTDRTQMIEEQGTNFKRTIDSTTNDMVVQMAKHLQEELDSLDKHEQVLESLKKYLIEEQKDFTKVLHDGSAILKFDIGNAVIDKADGSKVPEHPNISDLQHIKCGNPEELIKKALGVLEELNHLEMSSSSIAQRSPEDPQREPATSEHSVLIITSREDSAAHRYSSIITQSTWSDKDPKYRQISPITNDAAWAGTRDKDNQLHLISSTGQSLQKIQTVNDFLGLSVHPTTGVLYGGFSDDKTIRTIDTETGATTVVVQCDIKPSRIMVTKESDVLVGECPNKYPVYRYKLTGKLVHKTPEKYKVYDIDQCTRTKRVVVACDTEGVMILNNNLKKINSFTGITGVLSVIKKKFECTTAVFDSQSNLIVGDYKQKEVYILEGNRLTMIQKVSKKEMSSPARLKLYNNILWVQCHDPRKVMCIEMK